MLYTDSFVFVHMPKTGGTFVTHSIFEIYGEDHRDLLRLNSRMRWRARLRGGLVAQSPKYGRLIHSKRQHARREAIEDEHRQKTVLGIVRNPFDYLVSDYDYRWWTRPDQAAEIRRRVDLEREFPKFPDLSFSEFVDLRNRASSADSVGPATRRLVDYYFRDRSSGLRRLRDDALDREAVQAQLGGVRLLRNEDLNEGLRRFLIEKGYAAGDVDFLNTKERVVPDGPGKRRSRDWREYYTPELFELVRERERLFLELFPEYDVPLAVDF